MMRQNLNFFCDAVEGLRDDGCASATQSRQFSLLDGKPLGQPLIDPLGLAAA
jgi:hypothetical protein